MTNPEDLWRLILSRDKCVANLQRENEELVDAAQNRLVALRKLEVHISELESEIVELKSVIRQYERVYGSWISRYLGIIFIRWSRIFRSRLGWLSQYHPRTLSWGKSLQVDNSEELLKISIVTPSYQQGAFLEQTIQSILDQQYPKLQYFIQDGGSTDNTLDILSRYETNLAGWSSGPDSGQCQAINVGFSKTDGDIMAWVNSDDLIAPGTLHMVSQYFSQNPDVDVVYGNRKMINEFGHEIGRWILPGHDDNVLSYVDYIPQETLFWRRRIWDKVGGSLDETYNFALDWDLLIRFRNAGARFAHIPRFLGAFRVHSEQKTLMNIENEGAMEMQRIRLENLGSVPTRRQIRNAVFLFQIKHICLDLIYRLKTRLGVGK